MKKIKQKTKRKIVLAVCVLAAALVIVLIVQGVRGLFYKKADTSAGLEYIHGEEKGDIAAIEKKIELLAPAGDMERLEMAVAYGADAVYLAGTAFGMRSFAGNFTPEELKRAVDLCHKKGVRVHVTCNTMPRNDEVARLPEWLTYLDQVGVDAVILADVGGEVAIKLVDKLRDRVNEKGLKTGEQAADELRDLIAEEMQPEAEMALDGHPAVILVIGVNGVGKTTSIAKLADYYTRQGRKVMLAAGDTFRAAASEQLEIWADRAGVPLVKAGEGADPAAVIFDTVKSATAKGYDMVIADTAGRLHNKANLMAELSKISRSVKKASPESSLETLLVLDAITGQNAISQAKEFCKAASATGIILTKLDGTAKGGCVVAVKQRLGLPVRFIGVGEGIDDLLPFTPEGFVEELIPRTGWKH